VPFSLAAPTYWLTTNPPNQSRKYAKKKGKSRYEHEDESRSSEHYHHKFGIQHQSGIARQNSSPASPHFLTTRDDADRAQKSPMWAMASYSASGNRKVIRSKQ
jgi:hypothetical protein